MARAPFACQSPLFSLFVQSPFQQTENIGLKIIFCSSTMTILLTLANINLTSWPRIKSKAAAVGLGRIQRLVYIGMTVATRCCPCML